MILVQRNLLVVTKLISGWIHCNQMHYIPQSQNILSSLASFTLIESEHESDANFR